MKKNKGCAKGHIMRSEYFFYAVNEHGEEVLHAERVACVDELLCGFIEKYRQSLMEARMRIKPAALANVGIAMGCSKTDTDGVVPHWVSEYQLYEQTCIENPALFAGACPGQVVALLEKLGNQQAADAYRENALYAPQTLCAAFWNFWDTQTPSAPKTPRTEDVSAIYARLRENVGLDETRLVLHEDHHLTVGKIWELENPDRRWDSLANKQKRNAKNPITTSWYRARKKRGNHKI